MEDNCSTKPRNFKEFIKSSWFVKPLIGILVGTILGLIFFSVSSNNPFHTIYGDILAGSIVGLFFINIPCMTCNSEKKNNL